MIVNLPSSSVQDVSKAMVRLRNETGSMTLGRVMTLIIVTDEDYAEESLEAAAQASRQHPSRIIVVVRSAIRAAARMDAQIRLGGDAGASEIIVLRLYGELSDHGDAAVIPLLLADSPVVAWWPHEPGSDVAGSPIGKMADRRITDASSSKDPRRELQKRREHFDEGDTDMAWSRATRWRGLLAAALDQPPYEPVTSAVVTGASDSASADLLAGWLAICLKCPVRRVNGPAGRGLISVRLQRASGPIDLVRTEDQQATLSQPGHPVRRLALHRPTTADCLAEELRRLDKDDIYRETLLKGLPKVTQSRTTSAKATRKGETPSVQRATAEGKKAARRADSSMSARSLAKRSAPTAKKSAARKSATSTSATKATAKKAATTKTTAKKTTAKKTAAKKAPARKKASKRASTKAEK
ncbi:glucose-6-phosphate dehydrogenase assembly protein OpcA [Branchiibius hedensis]|uniref:Glucose-6-phosphate dehydrogenase assembly protein OpcA n=1 Tax=Branchiibius hedensis TaxID=672460 RepID=A0A2Y8ZQC4_9MICO|nr:glucose-6-phosphate dehydrogenase assembly protein OpcA [Branchiibius hedensis]PWJ25230.1 glucose-6-phosphate dehydrogenase assembly protein OpcA [Branchiibius hedensis]SSA34044.1 glucose-6-phosphate dehydrogenase assembly protein OpcA [Branchiibius hedensis]